MLNTLIIVLAALFFSFSSERDENRDSMRATTRVAPTYRRMVVDTERATTREADTMRATTRVADTERATTRVADTERATTRVAPTLTETGLNTDSVQIEERLAKMSLKQKIGQLIIHTVAPTTDKANKDNIKNAVKEYGVGGLLFSGGTLDNQVELTNWAQSLAEIPLMITFDGEWGLAMRLKGTPSFPRNRVLGCIANDTLIYRYGKEVARELREIGVNVNFAPVADVDNNPRNPVINTRSFGSDPEEVARKVIAYSRGLQDGGVLAVAKHFPGHGDTETDSHLALPHLKFDRTRLDSIELVPFRKAIQAGVEGVMVGHLHVPALSDKTASVSGEVIHDLLQTELGFHGLTFTDALEMKGISSTPDVSAQALIAGNDMVLAQRNLKREIAGILKAVKDGRLTEEQITEKCRKVLTYKQRLGLDEYKPVSKEGLTGRINTPETQALMTELREAAVTLLKAGGYKGTGDRKGTGDHKGRPYSDDMAFRGAAGGQKGTGDHKGRPYSASVNGTPQRATVLALSPTAEALNPFCEALRTTLEITVLKADAYSIDALRAKLLKAERIIVAVNQNDCSAYAALIKNIAEERPVSIACFKPQKALKTLSPAFQAASEIILAHSGEEEVQEHTALCLTGLAEATGKLSVGFDIFKTGTTNGGRQKQKRIIGPPEYKDEADVPTFNMRHSDEIDSIAIEGIRGKAYPGCQILILKDGMPVYDKCFGTYTYNDSVPVTRESIYDIASLSKATGTLLAVMKLYDEGRFALTDKISKYLDWLKGTNKANISIETLLYHQSGIQAYLPFYDEAIDRSTCKNGLIRKYKDQHHQLQIAASQFICTDYSFKPQWVSTEPNDTFCLHLTDSLYLNINYRQQILQKIAKSPLKSRVYRYSCLNFMLLKELVETLTDTPMDIYLDSVFFRPMGLRHTAYCPLNRFPKQQIVPSAARDFLRRGEVRGYVNDEGAALMGGVSGNAGMFANAHDVGAIFQMLLNKGSYHGERYLSAETCELFMTKKSRISRRGLGFDKPAGGDSGPCSKNTPKSVFGHTGFTGTCAWADPDNNIVYVFLSNRLWPQAYGSRALNRLKIRQRIQEEIYKDSI